MPVSPNPSEVFTETANQAEVMQVMVTPPRRIPLSLIVGGVIVGMFLILALIGPHITPYPFDKFHFGSRLAPPSADFWWGTDRYGRDIFSRVIHGARLTVFMAGTGTIIGVAFGLLIGLFSGYVGGWIDEILMRLTDIAMSFPGLLLAMLVVAALGSNEVNAVLSIGIVFVPKVARVVRSATLGLRHIQFVEAAEVRGESNSFIIFREILPNALSPLVAEMGLRFIFSVLFISTLSFLGLGIQPPTADWGGMVKDNKDGIIFGIQAALIPGGAIAALAVCVNMVVDWLLKRTSSLKGGRGDV